VQRLSRLKAEIVATTLSLAPAAVSSEDTNNHLLNIILSADTVVVLKDRILGKPNDPAEATDMLKLLRQRPHYVYSGLTVASQRPNPVLRSEKWRFITRLHQSKVWMRSYTDVEIEQYVASGSPLDKAGAYGIQDQPFAPVARLEGCYASVMGLPLGELAAALKAIKLVLPDVAPRCTKITGTSCCLLSRNG
jgi:MAF protein